VWRFLNSRPKKIFAGIAAGTVLAVVAGGLIAWRIEERREARERAELAAELQGEGVPPALAHHLAETLPESLVENGFESPTSAVDEHFAALAYPASDISLANMLNTANAYSVIKGKKGGQGGHAPGTWTLYGPTKAVYPPILNRHGSEYITSGRITSIALDPACTTRCQIWIGAAGGGVWRQDKNGKWDFVSGALPSNAIGSLVYDAAHQTLYVGTGEANSSGDSEAGMGVFKSTDGGNTWTGLGGNSVFLGRAVGAIAIDPTDPNVLYAATTRAVRGVSSVTGGAASLTPGAARWGLYKSTNGGASFTFIHNGSADPTLCTGDANEANGLTPCSPRGVRSLAIDPSDHNIVYAGSMARGVWRSSDAGATWVLIHAPLTTGAGFTSRPMIAVTTVGGHTRMYLGEGAQGSPTSRVWRSDQVESGSPTFALLTSSNPADRGYATFDYCTGQCWYDNFVYTPPGYPDIVYVGGSYGYNEDHLISNARGVVLSQDAGATWSDMTEDATSMTAPNGLHPDQHVLVTRPNNPLEFWEGSDGGLMHSNGTLTDVSGRCDSRGLGATALQQCKWLLSAVPTKYTSENQGLSTLQFQSLTVNPADSKNVQGGTQDNGTFETTASQVVWPQTIFGDGGQSGFDSTNPAFRVHTYFNASPDVNFNNGNPADWGWIADPIYQTEPQAFYVPIITDPVVSGTMFVGTGHVWRTTTFGLGSMTQAEFNQHCNEFTGDFTVQCGDWQPLGGGSSSTQLINAAFGDRAGGTVAATERATSDHSTLWAATSTGRVFVSQNADAASASAVSFARIDTLAGNDPGRFVSGIQVDPANPLHAWISYLGYNENTPAQPGHVFSVTYDPGASTATWTSLDGTGPSALGNLPATDVVLDSVNGDLYVSSDFGVMRLPSDTGNWQLAGANLPAVEVAGITIVPGSRVLYAATHGRGAWKLVLP